MKKLEKNEEKDSLNFVLWNVSFLCSCINGIIILSSRWMVTNRKESMSLAIGSEYWKGIFAQCVSANEMNFHCDNYEVPWFLFDSLVLSSRFFMVLALIFIILGHSLMFICGKWNYIFSRLKEENNRVFKNLVRVSAVFYFFAGLFLIIVSALFTDIILKSYAADSKFGPVNGNVVVQQQNQNTVRYEFGACLYLGYIFGFLELSLGFATICFNPYSRKNDEGEDEKTSSLDYGYDGETFHSYQ